MTKFVCDIVTPEKKLYSNEAYMVVVPGELGSMGFLPGHTPLLSLLADGVVRIQNTDDAEMHQLVLQGGYVEVAGDRVLILADRAINITDIDLAAAKSELEKLTARKESLSTAELQRTTIEADIEWYKNQVRVKESEK